MFGPYKIVIVASSALFVLISCASYERHSTRGKSAIELPAAAALSVVETDHDSDSPTSSIGGANVRLDDSYGSSSEPETFVGTGSFINQPKNSSSTRFASDSESIVLSFADVELQDTVRAVLADTLGLNYIVDPKVKGRVLVSIRRPLTRVGVLSVLEEVLRIEQAALVDTGSLLKIVPINEAAKSGIKPTTREHDVSGRPGFRLKIVRLYHISAGQMASILNPFVRSDQMVKMVPDRNLLVLSGTRQEIDSVTEFIQMFDVDWLAGMSFGIHPVKAINAQSMVLELKKIFGDEDTGPVADKVRFETIEHMNAVLIIAQDPLYLDRAQTWLKRLDKSRNEAGQQLFVYKLQHRRAVDVEPVLTKIFSDTQQESFTVRKKAVAPGLTQKRLRSRSRRELPEPSAGVQFTGRTQEKPDAKSLPGQETEAVAIREVRDSTSVRQSTPNGDVGSKTGTGSILSIKVTADDQINALIVLATPREYRVVESTLRRLDILPLQVLIEATIAEVGLNDELRFGVQWFFDYGNHDLTLSEAGSGAAASIFPGFSYVFSSSDVRLVMNALDSVTDVNVISSPRVMALDNHAARIQVGDQVPIATSSSQSVTDPEAPIVNTIQFVDTGVVLEVTPRVNESGVVFLDIMQEVSDPVVTTSSEIDSPTIQQRRIETTAAVHHGDTVALGGLIRKTFQEGVAGIPFLMDIPILGHAFKTTTKVERRTELLVLITPRIIRNRFDAKKVTEELRGKLKLLRSTE